MPLILSVICLWRRLPSTGGSSPRKIRLGRSMPTSYDGWEADTWWWMDRMPWPIRPSAIERNDRVTAIDDSFMISDVDMGWYQRWWRWGGAVWLLDCLSLAGCMIWFVGWDFYDIMNECVCMHLYAVLLNSDQSATASTAKTDRIDPPCVNLSTKQQSFILDLPSIQSLSFLIKGHKNCCFWTSAKYISLSAHYLALVLEMLMTAQNQWLYPRLPAEIV